LNCQPPDTHELTKKWREEIDQGISPMTDWAAPPKQSKQPKQPKQSQPQPQPSQPQSRAQAQGVEDVQDLGGGPLADAQAAMDRSTTGDEAIAADGFTAPTDLPRVEEMPAEVGDGPKPRVDIDEPEAQRKLNPNQVVVGTGPQ